MVRWLDAHGSADATAVYEREALPHGGMVVETYGLLVRDDEEGVSVVSEALEGGTFRGHTFVPRALILAVDDLRRYRKNPAKNPTNRRLGSEADDHAADTYQ